MQAKHWKALGYAGVGTMKVFNSKYEIKAKLRPMVSKLKHVSDINKSASIITI